MLDMASTSRSEDQHCIVTEKKHTEREHFSLRRSVCIGHVSLDTLKADLGWIVQLIFNGQLQVDCAQATRGECKRGMQSLYLESAFAKHNLSIFLYDS